MEGTQSPEGMEDADQFFCESTMDMQHFLHYSLVPSVLIILVLSCLEKRPRRWRIEEKIPKFSGYGAFVVPFDFVRAFNNRWSYGFAFGATADKLMFLFENDYMPAALPSWAKVFWVLLIAIEVGISSYPLFACLSTSYRITGAIFGSLYTTTWLIVMFVDIAECPQGKFVGEYENVIRYWPSLLCQLALLGRFLHILVKALSQRCGRGSGEEETSLLEEHQAQYVQRLLRKPPLQQKSWIQRKLYEWDPCFRFPSRMISTAVVIFICLYMFIMLEYIASNLLLTLPIEVLKTLQNLNISSNDTSDDPLQEALGSIEEFFNIAKGVWFCTTGLASLTFIGYVFRILVRYRQHMRLLRAGKKNSLMSEEATISSSVSVVALGRYASWQVAYILWGYLVIHLVLFVAGMVLMYVLILPMKYGQWMQLLNKWGTVILSLAIVMAVKQLQVVIASQFFLQPKMSPDDKQKPLALDNRKAFHNFSYFLFFFTVVVGLTSCLLRLMRSVVIGAWLVGRIDRPVMPQGFERFDGGFKTWLGMLFVDHYHTNPVLVCFCHILITQREKELQRSTTQLTLTKPTRADSRVSEKARTRWFLLYTLLNNPHLVMLRKPKSEPQSVDFPQLY